MNSESIPSRRATFLLCGLLGLGAPGLACDRGDASDGRDPRSVPCSCDECCEDTDAPGGSSEDDGGYTSGGADTFGDDGCTLTQGYWKNHSEYGKNPSQREPWPVDEDTALCGSTWFEILLKAPKGDAWVILAHQWIAASLNVAAGAEAPPDVAAALAEAGGYLADCSVSADERDAALAASELLDAFNNGEVGPGHCGDGGGETGGGDTADDETSAGDSETGWPIPG